MKYRKAADVLPDALLEEVLKYVSEGMLYFPKRVAHKKWGEDSGARGYYQLRNEEIRARFRAGERMADLAACYGLAPETIRKIIYEQRKDD